MIIVLLVIIALLAVGLIVTLLTIGRDGWKMRRIDQYAARYLKDRDHA